MVARSSSIVDNLVESRDFAAGRTSKKTTRVGSRPFSGQDISKSHPLRSI
jgi:hypothetical protein